MPDMSEYIWIAEAAEAYKRSRAWLDEQVRHGRLTYVKFEGNRRTYLKRAELDKMLGKPAIEKRRDVSDAG